MIYRQALQAGRPAALPSAPAPLPIHVLTMHVPHSGPLLSRPPPAGAAHPRAGQRQHPHPGRLPCLDGCHGGGRRHVGRVAAGRPRPLLGATPAARRQAPPAPQPACPAMPRGAVLHPAPGRPCQPVEQQSGLAACLPGTSLRSPFVPACTPRCIFCASGPTAGAGPPAAGEFGHLDGCHLLLEYCDLLDLHPTPWRMVKGHAFQLLGERRRGGLARPVLAIAGCPPGRPRASVCLATAVETQARSTCFCNPVPITPRRRVLVCAGGERGAWLCTTLILPFRTPLPPALCSPPQARG